MSNSKDDGEVDSAEFARILTKQAVAHVCVAIGFTATTPGALDCLTDVVQRYVESLAKRTMENTYRAGRTEANIPDVLQGFQQLPIPLSWTELRDFAFSDDGYSSRNHNIAARGNGNSSNGIAANGGGVGGGARDKVGAGAGAGREEIPKRWDQPFHHTVPAFPMPRKRVAPWGEVEEDDDGAGGTKGPSLRPPHIPEFMPPLPPSTSRDASAGSGRSLGEIRLERLKRQRQGETALRSLGAPVAAGAAAAGAATRPSAGTGTTPSGKPGGISKIIIRLPSSGVGSGGVGAVNGGRRTSGNGDGRGGGAGGSRSGSFDGGHSGDRPWQENGRAAAATTNRAEAPPKGFRKIVPNAAGASARSSALAGDGEITGAPGEGGAAAAVGGAGGADSVKARVLKGIAAGGRGAFGKSNDSTREDRILEGIPPDGTADSAV